MNMRCKRCRHKRPRRKWTAGAYRCQRCGNPEFCSRRQRDSEIEVQKSIRGTVAGCRAYLALQTLHARLPS